MPLSLADLFAYHADEAVRTAVTRNDQKDRESRLELAQKWIQAAATLRHRCASSAADSQITKASRAKPAAPFHRRAAT